MDLQQYDFNLSSLLASQEFADLDPNEQQDVVKGFREDYITKNPDAQIEAVDSLTESRNKNFLRAVGQGRAIPDLKSVVLPSQEEGYADLSQSEKREKLDAFKLKIPDIAKSNPTQKEDTEFFLKEQVRELERRNNGSDKGYIADLGTRATEGLVAGLAGYLNMPQVAEDVRDYFNENTKYDENLTAKLAQGLGDVGASMAIYAAVMATTKGLGGGGVAAGRAATTASLASNAALRYNEAYKNAIDSGLDEIKAGEAGVASMPAAVIDVLGDKIIANNLFGKAETAAFKTASQAERKAILAEAFKDASFKSKLTKVGVDAMGEGLTEVVGDNVAAYGPYLVTGNNDFIPNEKENRDSFIIGALLGGGVSAAVDVPDFVGDKKITTPNTEGSPAVEKFNTKEQRDVAGIQKNLDKIDPSEHKQIFDLIDQKNYKEAYKKIESLTEEEAAPVAKPFTQPEDIKHEEEPIEVEGEDVILTEAPTQEEIQKASEEVQSAELTPTQEVNPTPIAEPEVTPTQEVAPVAEPEKLNIKSESEPIVFTKLYESKSIDSPKYFPKGFTALAHPQQVNNLDVNLAPHNIPVAGKMKQATVAKVNGIPVVKMNVSGVVVPFYQSPSGKWYPGNASEPVFADREYHNSPTLKAVGEMIDKTVGDTTGRNDIITSNDSTLVNTKNLADDVEIKAVTSIEPSNIKKAKQQEVEKQKEEYKKKTKIRVEPHLNIVPNFTGTATDFLNELIKNKASTEQKARYRSMLNDIKTKNPKLNIKFGVLPKGYEGLYDSKTNEIILTSDSESILIHEVAHALTFKEIESYLSKIEAPNHLLQLEKALADETIPEHIKELINVYLHSAKFLGYEELVGKDVNHFVTAPTFTLDQYAHSSIHEFAAYAFSDKNFQERLALIPYQGSTTWQKFVDALVKSMNWLKSIASPEDILRSDNQNVLTTTLASIREIIDSDLNDTQSEGKIASLSDTIKNSKADKALKRLNAIRKGSLNDKFDIGTIQIQSLLSSIKPSDIMLLSEDMQEYAFALIDNVYNSRKSAISSPSIRFDTDELIDEINEMKSLINQNAIADMIDTYDSIIDFDAMTDVDFTDSEAVQKAINEVLSGDALLNEAASALRKSKRNAKTEKMYEKYRTQYKNIRQQVNNKHPNFQSYLDEYVRNNGEEFNVVADIEFLKAHYDYLTQVVDINALAGNNLYQHFYAANNLRDGNFAYLKLTADYIASKRDEVQNVSQYTNTFRNSLINRNAIIEQVDKLNINSELIQTQMFRYSAYPETQKFLQEYVYGPLLHKTISVAHTYTENEKDVYKNAVELFQKAVGREQNTEDQVIGSIVGRLVQYETGTDPDAALKRNILKERQSITNRSNKGWKSQRNLFSSRIEPIFNKLIEGIEELDSGAMDTFMRTLVDRMAGSEPIKVGVERKKLLDTQQQIFAKFNAISKIYSEGFHKQPFHQQVLYVPNDVLSTNQTAIGKDVDITDPAGQWESYVENKGGVKTKASHFEERSAALGENNYYSYNPNDVVERNLVRMATDTATLPERFIIKSRLKKTSELSKAISGGEKVNQERLDDILQVARQFVGNAFARGEAHNVISNCLRAGVNMYATVKLSSLHHIITQPLAALSDYAIRTGNYKGWLDASLFIAQNKETVDRFFKTNQRWTGDRGVRDVMSLDTRRMPHDDSLESPSIKKIKDTIHAQMNKVPGLRSLTHDNIGDFITTSLRIGDQYSTRATVLAEYVRLMNEKGYKISSMSDVDWENVEGEILTQAVVNSERNINTSGKALRGELFSDRRMLLSVLRNLLFAFQSHSGNISTQVNQNIRDIVELKGLNAPQDLINIKYRNIAAMVAQQFTFTTARWVYGSMMTYGIISLVRSLYDQPEDKLEELEKKLQIAQANKDKNAILNAQQELRQGKAVNDIIIKMKTNTQSFDSYFKQVIRDQTGTVYLGLNNNDIQRMLMTVIPVDKFGEHIYKQSHQEVSDDLARRIREAKERKDLGVVAKLEAEKADYDAVQYVPFVYDNNSGFETGGIYGGTIGGIKTAIDSTWGGATGMEEFGFNDFLLLGNAMGVGQADFSKVLKAFDKIENKQWQNDKENDDRKKKAKENPPKVTALGGLGGLN